MELLPVKQEIKQRYTELTPVFKEILHNIQMKLSIVISLKAMPIYKARVKAFESYYKKILKLKSEQAKTDTHLICLTDMIGIRVICSFLEDLSNVQKQIASAFDIVEVERKGEKDFSEFCYESIHVLVKIPQDCLPHKQDIPIPKDLVCEIQIRTILQDAWAEVEHELIYKTQFSPFDSPLRRKLAAIKASLSLADIIFQEIRDYQNKLKKELDFRHDRFYDKADLLCGNQNSNTPTISLMEHEDINRPAPFVWGAIDDMVLEALHEHNAGNMDNAILIYTRIIESRPAPSVAVQSVIYKHRGMAFFAKDKYDSALQDFQSSIECDGNNFMAWYYKGIVQSIQGNNEDAVSSFNSSLAINPYQAHVHYRRALSYYNMTDYEKALGDLQQAARLGLDDKATKNLHDKLMKKFDMKM